MPSIKRSEPAGLLDARQLGRLHSASLEILRDTGMAFGSPEAVAIFKSHGLKTSGQTVFFTDRIIEKSLEMAPDELTLIGRNPEHNLDFNLETQIAGPGSGAVYIVDHQGRVSSPTREDFFKALKLAQVLPQMKYCRPLFVPHDVPPARLQAWMMAQQILHQDKPYFLMDADDISLLSLAFGKSEAEMRDEALIGRVYGYSLVNVVSPLYLPQEACRNIIRFCRSGIAFYPGAMPSAGSTAPAALSAALILQNCENLGALVLAQLISPGHPVFYGAMGGHNDMRTLNAVYGGPENRFLELAGSQLARYYGLLSRGNIGNTDAPSGDFQAGAETMFQVFSAALQKVNFISGFGLLGSYMGGSLEKLILDTELYGYVNHLLRPLKFGEDDLALEVIKEIGPKGNFLNHPHTFKKFKGEFYFPETFKRTSYEGWRREGSLQAMDWAHSRLEPCLDSYKRPDIDPGLKKDLLKYC